MVSVNQKQRDRSLESLRDNVEGVVEEAREAAQEFAQSVKPKLRGWLHAGMAPLALLAGLVLVVFAPSQNGRITAAVFTLTAFLLFGTSAVYHRGDWSPRTTDVLKRLDHSNIFLIIAGSYTAFRDEFLARYVPASEQVREDDRDASSGLVPATGPRCRLRLGPGRSRCRLLAPAELGAIAPRGMQDDGELAR